LGNHEAPDFFDKCVDFLSSRGVEDLDIAGLPTAQSNWLQQAANIPFVRRINRHIDCRPSVASCSIAAGRQVTRNQKRQWPCFFKRSASLADEITARPAQPHHQRGQFFGSAEQRTSEKRGQFIVENCTIC
jgi:hypothetical protein